MAPLAVDPVALDGAGSAVVSAGDGLGSVVSTLSTALGGCNGMAGDDPASAAFGRSYDNSARKLLQAMATTRNGLCCLGYGVRMSAHNYSMADAMSDVSGRGEPIPVPHPSAAVSAGSAPSAVGSCVGAPAGWSWVAPFIGMIWPNGDSAKLRDAAAAWMSAGTNFEVSEITGVAEPMGSIGAQQIPEGPAIAAASGDAARSAAGISQQCVSIATQLTAYAAKIDHVHAAIMDLLSRICDPMTGLKEVWEFLTDQDEDEIKKIANDIRTIIDQFTTEVDALRHQIAKAVTEAETILTTMGRYAEKEWDQFLHGTEVGRALNQVGQFGKGVVEEAGGQVKDGWTYGLVRAAVDPQGWYHSWDQMIGGMAPLVGLGGNHAPGVAEAWKDLGKNAVHWDEWKTNPAEAAGKSTFDIASLFVPGGGEGAAAAKGARTAADAAEAAAKTAPREAAVPRALGDAAKPSIPAPEPHAPHVEAPPHGKPTPPHDEPTPHSEVPGGRPESAPPPKDAPAHPDPSPHSPVESKAPPSDRPLPGEGPKPQVEPSDPGHGPPPAGGGSPPPPGQGPPPPGPHQPLPGSSPGEGHPPAEPSQPAPQSPPGEAPPPAEPPQPAPPSPSGEGPPHAAEPSQPAAASPWGEGSPPADAPHQPAATTPLSDSQMSLDPPPQSAAAVPSGEVHTPASEAAQPVAAVPSGLGHPALDGEHLPPSCSPAPAPFSAGTHSAELAANDAHVPQPRPTAPSGRPSNLPGAERSLADHAEPRGGRPVNPHGGAAVDHPTKTAPLSDKPSRLGDGSGRHSTEPGHGGDGHGGSGHGGGDHDESSVPGLSDEKRNEILAMEKGTRPDPSEYLSPEYIEHHLDKFHDGATRFMPESNFDKYGIAQRDGTSFVMPKNKADALVDAARGDPRALEKSLGLHEGFLDSKKLVRIDISHPDDFNLRMPSGNEAGANEQWIPGGLLPDGAPEAILDGGKIPRSDYSVTDVSK